MKQQAFHSHWLFCKQGGTAKEVCLPHDAMQEELRGPASPSGSACAYFAGGVYTYEKKFFVPLDWKNKHIELQFEGVYKNSTVSINGTPAGGAAYGYIPFFVCVDDLLHYDAENTVQVVADNSDMPNSRWYSGAGIYRPVWLWMGEKTYIAPEGVRISTLSVQPPKIQVEVVHTGGAATVEILDGETVIVKEQGSNVTFSLPTAKLWSAQTPHLYQCRVTLTQQQAVVDIALETFGIRKVEWSAKGLFVNGAETLLRGGCVHHDNGILGAASYKESEMRRVKKLKEAGFNAIRASHNPATKAMLQACDQFGMYVIEEAWDMWYKHKNKYDYATDFPSHYKADLKAMVDRDFNHPAVIMYSIGNEVSEPATSKGVALAKEIIAYLHTLDQTRAVTGGMNLMILHRSAHGKDIYKEDGGRDNTNEKKVSGMSSTMFNMMASMVGTGMNRGANSKTADAITTPVLDALDIAGYNYASGRYGLEGKAHPARVLYGSETFPQDIVKNWSMVKKYPYLVGDFMWTCWDYLGEAGIGAWAYTADGKGFEKPYPWLLADVGAMDILGNPNGALYLAQATWGCLKAPAIAVQPVNHQGIKPAKAVWRGTNALPSWSWSGCEGNRALVEVYTHAAAVELFVNEKSMGKRRVKAYVASFALKYTAGTLRAVAYDAQGAILSQSELCSATGKTSICITPEIQAVQAEELVYFEISLVGENGVVEANCDTPLTLVVEGGTLLAFGSANPRTEERYNSGCFTPYYGRAQAIVKAGAAGSVTLTATGKGLPLATAQIAVK